MPEADRLAWGVEVLGGGIAGVCAVPCVEDVLGRLSVGTKEDGREEMGGQGHMRE